MGLYIHGDCMNPTNGLPSYPDNHFQLAIVDTPYGIGESGKTNKSRGKLAKAKDYGNKDWDKSAPPQQYFDELIRVSQNQIIWGANHFISKIPYDSPCWIIWDKVNGDNDFADVEMAWTSFKTAARLARFRWAGMLQGDMKNKEFRIHPTQKPVKLYQWCLNKYAKQGDLILDTHVGSASSLVACESMGFDYVGYEKDRDYYTDSSNRLSLGVQKQLF